MLVATTATAADGSYGFSGLVPGDYTVEEVLPDGTYAITPVTVGLTLTSGDAKTADFLNCRYGTISGYKFEDSGRRRRLGPRTSRPSRAGRSPWTARPPSRPTLPATSSSTSWTCGTYVVSEEAREGWFSTTPATVEVELGCGGGGTGHLRQLPLRPRSAASSMRIPTDSGTISAGDAPVAGVTIKLWKGAVLVATTATAADGSYGFSGLVPGDYTVEEVLPDGTYAVTPVTVGLTLTSGDAKTADFLNCRYGTISGYKFEDSGRRRRLGPRTSRPSRAGRSPWTARPPSRPTLPATSSSTS